MLRTALLRLVMGAFGLAAMAIGGVSALFPGPITELFGLSGASIVFIGLCGALLTALGLGSLLAARNPVRHLLWLKILIGFLIGIALYAGLLYRGGVIEPGPALLLVGLGGVFAALLFVLFPRAPRLVSVRVRSPDGVLFTDPDQGGLFIGRRDGGFNPYVIRLPRPAEPAPRQPPAPLPIPDSASRVMIVGSGAREHAIAVKLRMSAGLDALYTAPGNGGTALIAVNLPIPVNDVEGIVRAAQEREVGLVIVGPEEPLAHGLGDALREAGILCLGPTKAAARLEWSKAFAKQVMDEAGVATARWARFTDYALAAEHVRARPMPLVIKADGLAAGKGVAVCSTEKEALTFLHHVMRLRDFGDAGDSVIIEEALSGRELSAFAFCHDEQILVMAPACDYKRIHDGDIGPNTGGMGSYSPPEFADDRLLTVIQDTVFRPVLRHMSRIGAPYSGILYAGLMLTDDGLKVLEFNCRMGDPEAQVVLPRITSDFLQLATATAAGAVDSLSLTWTERPGVAVVLASGGYPDTDYARGLEITGLSELDPDVMAFHAGTRLDPATGALLTSGGRVMTITALGDTMAEARAKAYTNAERVSFTDVQFRKDIALRAVSSG